MICCEKVNLEVKKKVGFFFFLSFFWSVEKTSDKCFSLYLHMSVKRAVGNFCLHSWEHVYSDNFIQGTSYINFESYLDDWRKEILTKIPRKDFFTGKSRGTQFKFHLLHFRGHLLSCWSFRVPFS